MDGVLIDSEPLHLQAWREALQQVGLQFDDAWFAQWVGVPDTVLAEHVAAANELPVSSAALRDAKRERFRSLAASALRTYDGVLPGLQRLAACVHLACATGSARREAVHALRVTGLDTVLETLVSADDVARSKPAPDTFLKAAELLGVEPGACVAVEDSPTGIAAAQTAGLRVLGVSTTHAAHELPALQVFPSTAAALQWVAEQVTQA